MNSTYQCTQCKQTIQVNSNTRGVDFTNHCIITPLCSGQLVGTSVTATQSVSIPRTPRNVLFIFQQQLSESVWKVAHDLNSNPSIKVYADTIENGKSVKRLMDVDDYVATYNNPNLVTIEFATQTTGEVHLISRSSNPVPTTVTSNDTQYGSITTNGILTIAHLVRDDILPAIDLSITTISPSTNEAANHSVMLNPHEFESEISLFDTPWQSVNTITVNGQLFKLYSGRITNVLSANSVEVGSPFTLSMDGIGLILLTKPPKESVVDIVDDKVIPVGVITTDAITPTSTTSSTQFLVDSTLLTTYHPTIKIITTIF